MLKHKSALFPALLTFVCLGAAPVKAASPVTYVSGKGSDSNDCSSPAAPCRSFHRAVNQTAAGGEVKALDPANYFPVTINKAITITGVAGAGIVADGGTAINIISPASTVNLANLLIRNQNASSHGSTGIGGIGLSLLTVKQCEIQSFVTGIDLHNTTVLNGTGFDLGPFAFILLARSTVIGNQLGFKLESLPHEGGPNAESFGNNHIIGNGTDFQGGTLTKVGTQ